MSMLYGPTYSSFLRYLICLALPLGGAYCRNVLLPMLHKCSPRARLSPPALFLEQSVHAILL